VGTTSIRPMTIDDKPAVMRILQATPEFLPPEVIIAEELIDAFLEDPATSGYYIRVAEVGGEIAGYICYGNTPLTEATWDIYWIAVAHDIQGHGIGRILMKHAEDDIKKMHGRLIVVETSGKAEYNKTRQFYDNLNYQRVCQIPDYYAPGDDLVMFINRFE
jgi:ribosomal protein S18 acetylase RimI-like enzyme